MKGKYVLRDIVTVRITSYSYNHRDDSPFSGLVYFKTIIDRFGINLSDYLRSFHILLNFIEEHQRYDYLKYLSAYMDEHEKVFHAYYYKSIGLPTLRDLVLEFDFLRDVQRDAFKFRDDYDTIFSIPPPEPDDFTDFPEDSRILT